MQTSSGMYDDVAKALLYSKRGSYADLSYLPVFRSSALFYALCSKTANTRVSFLNYWREKNNNPDVSVLITIRDAYGVKRSRVHERLANMSYTFGVRELLESSDDFRGSIEVEVYSADDLKFAFPGLSIFYDTPGGTSYVHSNQRVYNNTDDRNRSEALNPWQTGFTVLPELDPFIFIVNGPIAWSGGNVQLIAQNSKAQIAKYSVAFDAMPAYGAFDFHLSTVPGLCDFLNHEPGLCKINLPLSEVHMRFGVGNAMPDRSWLSVTHSYFDATEHDDYFNTSNLQGRESPAFIPFTLVDGIDVDLVLYPIYARCLLEIKLQAFNETGVEQYTLDLGTFKSPDESMRILDIRNILTQHGKQASQTLYVLQFSSSEEKLPTRITYGLNFRIGHRLGTNISASAYLAKTWGSGSRSWKWGPVVPLPQGRNFVMVCAFSKELGAYETRHAKLTVYGHAGELASLDLTFVGNSSKSICIESLIGHACTSILDDEILWYVVKSKHSDLDVNQVCISADGYIGGDHSF